MQDLLNYARSVLRANDQGSYTRPAPGQYPHQWNWDSAFIAIGLSHFDEERARQEIRSLLRGQWRSGMIPHIIYHQPSSEYFPDATFWQTENCPDASGDVCTSGITQPPVLATAVRAVYERSTGRAVARAFLEEVFPALLAYHRWLYRERDPLGEGLVAIVHPWESGLDDSPRWAGIMDAITPASRPAYRRTDAVHVPSDERPTDTDYDRFVYLIDLGRRAGWDQRKLVTESPFLVQDVLFNAVLHRANEDLRVLAAELNELADEIDGWLVQTSQAFANKLWDNEGGRYLDFDLRAGSAIPEHTIAAFIPLFAGLPDAEQARRLVAHLQDPAEYAPGTGSRYYVPTTSKASAHWNPRRYWRGPIWVVTNWLIIQGLRRYGYHDLAETVRQHTLKLVAQSGFREYYNPATGDGCGAADFSWTAALILDLLLNMGSTSWT